MAEKFRSLADGFWVAPQIEAADVRKAHAQGVTLIINNRPDNEEPGQPAGAEVEKAARAAGLDYRSIPISGPPSDAEIDALAAALEEAKGPILAYCRTGARSTVLRALVKARDGAPVNAIIEEAAAAGYDLSGLRPRLDTLSRGGGRSAG